MEIAALGVRVESNGVVKAADDLDRLARSSERAEKSTGQLTRGNEGAQRALNSLDRAAITSAGNVANLSVMVTKLGAVLGTAISAREVIKTADAWTNMQNRLRLVTNSTEELATATEDVYKIAMSTSSGLDATAGVYQRLARSAKDLGLEMSVAAQLTETVSKAAAISGSTASSVEQALYQLGQALDSGVLRGEEFNSVNEQANGIMQALSVGLGKTIAELREMAAAGQLTREVFINGINAARGFIDDKFDTRVKTVSQSMTDLNTAFTKYVGEVDKANGITAALSNGIGALAANLEQVITVAVVAASAGFARYATGVVASTVALELQSIRARKNAADQVALATAHVAAATAAAEEARVQAWLTGNMALQEAATAKLTAAKTRLTAAQAAVAVGGRSLLGVLGGPVGVAITAAGVAASFLALGGNAKAATVDLDNLSTSMSKLSEKQLELQQINLQENIGQLEKNFNDSGAALRLFQNDLDELSKAAANGANITTQELENVRRAVLEQAVAHEENAAALDKTRGVLDQVIQKIKEFKREAAGAGGPLVESVAKTSDEAARYLERLSGQAITAGLKTQTEQLNALIAAGKLVFTPEDQQKALDYAKKVDAANEALKRSAAGASSAKSAQSAYADLISTIQSKLEQNQLEIATNDKATESDRIRIKMEQDLAAGKIKLTAAQKSLVDASLAALAASEKEAAIVKVLNAATIERIDLTDSAVKSAYDELARNQELLETFGMSEVAIERLTLAKLRGQLADKETLKLNDAQVLALEKIIEAREKNIQVIEKLGDKERQKESWDRWAQEVGQIFDQVGQKLTDAIFDGGKSGAELLKDIFKTLTLRVLVQPVMQGLQGAITNTLGGLLGGGESGGLASLLGGANSLSSIYSAVTGGLTSTLASGAAAIGNAIGSSALTSFAAGMKGSTLAAGLAGPTTAGASGAMGLGATVGAALPWAAGGLAVASLAKSAFGLGGKEKTGEGFAGWIKGSRGGQDVLTYETQSRKGGWLRSGANYLDFRAGDPAVQAGISDLVAQTSSSLKAYADALNLNTKDIQEYAKHIFIPTMDKSAQEVQERILSEVNLYAQELTRDFWPALQEVRRGGEELTDTLARVAGSVMAVNPVLENLGVKTFDLSIAGGDAASKLADAFGGLEQFGQSTGAYYEAFFTQQDKFDNGLRNMSARFGEIGATLPDLSQSTDDVRKQIRAMIEDQDLNTEIGRRNFRVLVDSSTAVLELSNAAVELGIAAKTTETDLAALKAAIDNEAAAINRQILQATGDIAAIRREELEAINPANRALQERLWAIQDEAEAIRAQLPLQIQLMQLYGNTAGLRAQELVGMDEESIALQKRIWAIEDSIKAENDYADAMREWQALQDAVVSAFREVEQAAQREIEKLRQAAKATDDAMNALTKHVSEQQRIIETQISGYDKLLSGLRGIFDYLGAQIRDLRGTTGAASMYADQGRALIQQAITSGVLPDQDKLAQAVDAVRQQMGAENYLNEFERIFDAQVLANQLEQLQDQTEPQISLAEQQIELARKQIEELQNLIKKAQETVDSTRGVEAKTNYTEDLYNKVLSASSAEQLANAQIDAINSQLTYLAKLGGIESNTGTLIDAINRFLASVGEAGVSKPTAPGTTTPGGNTQLPKVPDVITNPNHQFSREQVLGKRQYRPVTLQEKLDYINYNADLLRKFGEHVAEGGYPNTNEGKAQFAISHWDQYGKNEPTRRYALGGDHIGGMRLVGELGPELEMTGPSRIFNHQKTQDIFRGMGRVSGTMSAEMQAIDRRAEQMIRMMETMGKATIFQLQRIARQLERWDTDGMPGVRDMDMVGA